MTDFIIVGAGIAGICFAETALSNNKSIAVISNTSQNSSLVAAGLYNPVILKRFSLPMDAAVHLEYMKPFYKKIEDKLDVQFDYNLPVVRRFASIEEQNNWFEAADKPALSPFLSTDLIRTKYEHLSAPYGFGRVLHTGYVDTAKLLTVYQRYLRNEDHLVETAFDHAELKINADFVAYRGLIAKHIVFAEGFGIHDNPLFNYLPLDGTKGELLHIHAPQLKLDVAVNAGVFILPIGNNMYKVGATYEWYDKHPTPTAEGKAELLEKLNELVTCDYEIVAHLAGIRPTTRDRKALIGTHHLHKNIHLLNGLGTRGVMLGPAMAKELYDSIEEGRPVDKAVNLKRFKF